MQLWVDSYGPCRVWSPKCDKTGRSGKTLTVEGARRGDPPIFSYTHVQIDHRTQGVALAWPLRASLLSQDSTRSPCDNADHEHSEDDFGGSSVREP